MAVSGIARVNIRGNGRVAYAWHSREFFNVRQDFRGGAVLWWIYCTASLARLRDSSPKRDRIWNCHHRNLAFYLDWLFIMVHVWIAYTECTDHRIGRAVRHLAGSVGACFSDDSRQERIDHVDRLQDNNPMHPSGEVGRIQVDNRSSPPGGFVSLSR